MFTITLVRISVAGILLLTWCQTAQIQQATESIELRQKIEDPTDRDMSANLAGLTTEEWRSIQSACSSEKLLDGPAAYNRCLASQLSALKDAPRTPDLSGLTSEEQRSIQSTHLSALKDVPKTPNLSGLTSDKRDTEEFSRSFDQEREALFRSVKRDDESANLASLIVWLIVLGLLIGALYLGVRLILAVIRWIERH